MTNYFLNQIDMKFDNYYLNPYTIKLNNNCLNLCLKNNDSLTCENNNNNGENIENIIKTLRSIILSNNFPITNQNNLFISITNSNIKELNYILSNNNNININIQDNDGDTPLHIAVFLCNYEACSILLSHDALLTVKDKRGQIPIHRICFCYNKSDIEKIIDLFDYYQKKLNLKKNIFDYVDIYGNTSLHLILNYFIKNKLVIDDKNINLINKLKSLTDDTIINKNNHTIHDLINILYVINI